MLIDLPLGVMSPLSLRKHVHDLSLRISSLHFFKVRGSGKDACEAI